MGNSPSSPPKPVLPPDELHVFKGLDGIPMEFSIPEIPEKRKPTDQFFLMVFLVLFTTLMGCCIYTLCFSDLKRVTNGYDNCGNICGEKNSYIGGINCTGKDFTEEKRFVSDCERHLQWRRVLRRSSVPGDDSEALAATEDVSRMSETKRLEEKEFQLTTANQPGRLFHHVSQWTPAVKAGGKDFIKILDFEDNLILMYTEETALENLDNLNTQPNECVDQCEDFQYIKVMNRCFKMGNMDNEEEVRHYFALVIDQQVLRDMRASIGYIIGMGFIALGLCFVLLLLFKYFVGGTVKTILISTMLFTIALTVHLWVSKRKHRTGTKWLLLIICIIITVGVFLSWKKINYVIRVFRETTNAIFCLPFLMLVPIWVFMIEVALTGLLLFLMVMYYSAGVLTHLYGEYYTYCPTGFMMFTIIYTFVFYVYLCAFLHGCQQMVVAGAVSTWYFSREKDSILGSPITDSFRNLRKYHLGSVAFGSLIVTIMKIIRLIVRGLLKKKSFVCFRILINCCIDLMEEFVHYASDQAYIIVAMHGQPFLTSGKRATKLLIENALSTLSVNTAGDFVLWMSKVLVVISTMICGEILDDGTITFFGVTIFIGGCLAALLAHCVFRNFEICVDTIFLCYCEDTYVHDGIEHPYYASPGLVAVVDEAKGVVEEQKMYNSIKTEEIPQTFV